MAEEVNLQMRHIQSNNMVFLLREDVEKVFRKLLDVYQNDTSVPDHVNVTLKDIQQWIDNTGR